MLINALLERKLLYSAEGHATGTECYISYAEPDAEKVILTFLNEVEIREQVVTLCPKLGLTAPSNINQLAIIASLRQDTSAVVCVLKPASAGDMTKEETELIEKMRSNPGIRDRVFYVFNRIDETWYNTQLRQRLDELITFQFQDTSRVYKTSGLLGFYGSQIKYTSISDLFGLDSVLAESAKNLDGREEMPQFVNELNRYCANSGKLSPSIFRISVNSFESPNENYTRILAEQGTQLINQLIQDSGIEEFRSAITHYLTQEKRPQLFANLADDLQPVCISLRKNYISIHRKLASQPREIETMKAEELERLSQQLQEIGEQFYQHIELEINQLVTNKCERFEGDFRSLQTKMISRLDELLNTFSVADAYSRATLSHRHNATAPLIAILT